MQRGPRGTTEDRDRSPRYGARYVPELISSHGGHAEGRYSLDARRPFSVEALTHAEPVDPMRIPVHIAHSAAGPHVLSSNGAYYVPGRHHAHTSIQHSIGSSDTLGADRQYGFSSDSPRRRSSYQPYPDWGERVAQRPRALQSVERYTTV